MKISELKNTVSPKGDSRWIGSVIELGMPRRERAENLIPEQEDVNQPKQQKGIQKAWSTLGELWDSIRRAKCHTIHLMEGKESGWLSVFEEIKAETFPHLTKIKPPDSRT